MRKRPSYKIAIEWIGENDEPASLDFEFVVGMISVQVIAAAFDVHFDNVAMDVINYRKKQLGKAV